MENDDTGCLNKLPPGFRFDPTDEELMLHFLYPKIAVLPYAHSQLIPELEFYQCSIPYQLQEAFQSNGQWFFYTKKTDNRVNENGYWVETDMDKPIYERSSNKLVGFKKCLEFYVGTSPVGVKTGWLMQEYHICRNVVGGEIHHGSRRKHLDANKWVLCRIQEICDNSHLLSILHGDTNDSNEVELSSLDEVFLSLEDEHEEIISCPY